MFCILVPLKFDACFALLFVSVPATFAVAFVDVESFICFAFQAFLEPSCHITWQLVSFNQFQQIQICLIAMDTLGWVLVIVVDHVLLDKAVIARPIFFFICVNIVVIPLLWGLWWRWLRGWGNRGLRFCHLELVPIVNLIYNYFFRYQILSEIITSKGF